jgi:hypothetical protein
MKLAAACRKVYRRATVAWRKRIIFRKSSTQRYCGPRKEVTASRMKITRCAGHKRMGEHKSKVGTKTIKKLTFRKRLWKGPECNTGIRDRGLRQHPQGRYEAKDLGSRLPRYVKKPDLRKVQAKGTGNFDMNFTKTTRLEIVKRIVR